VAWGVRVGSGTTVASGNITLTEPASTASGDLLVACIGYRSNAAFTVPGDWNLVATQQSSGDTDTTNGIASALMMWTIRGGSAPTLTFNRTAGDVATGVIVGYTGGHASAPFDVGSANTLAVANVNADTASLTTAEAGELIVAMAAFGDALANTGFDAATDPATGSGSTDTTTPPTNGAWEERFDAFTSTGADLGVCVGDAVRATAGSTGLITATTSAAARHAMVAAAFKLAAVGGGGTIAGPLVNSHRLKSLVHGALAR
jgi:hypothetical protein